MFSSPSEKLGLSPAFSMQEGGVWKCWACDKSWLKCARGSSRCREWCCRDCCSNFSMSLTENGVEVTGLGSIVASCSLTLRTRTLPKANQITCVLPKDKNSYASNKLTWEEQRCAFISQPTKNSKTKRKITLYLPFTTRKNQVQRATSDNHLVFCSKSPRMGKASPACWCHEPGGGFSAESNRGFGHSAHKLERARGTWDTHPASTASVPPALSQSNWPERCINWRYYQYWRRAQFLKN